MTTASGRRALTFRAFSWASRLAIPAASAPAAVSVAFSAASSTSAGSTSKARPAASSSLRRCWLAEASTRGGARVASVIVDPGLALRSLLAIVQKANDRGSRLLHGAPGHVDDGPSMTHAQPLGMGDLVSNLRAVHIVAEVAVGEKMHAIAADLGDALGTGNQAHNKGRMRLGQSRRKLDVGRQRQIGRLIPALGQVDTGWRLGGA